MCRLQGPRGRAPRLGGCRFDRRLAGSNRSCEEIIAMTWLFATRCQFLLLLDFLYGKQPKNSPSYFKIYFRILFFPFNNTITFIYKVLHASIHLSTSFFLYLYLDLYNESFVLFYVYPSTYSLWPACYSNRLSLSLSNIVFPFHSNR